MKINSPYLGAFIINPVGFLGGIVLAILLRFCLTIRIKSFLVSQTFLKMEVNMKKFISLICVTAGAALLGWSGDTFPKLQGNIWIDDRQTVTIWERVLWGVRFPPRPALLMASQMTIQRLGRISLTCE